MSRIRTAEVRKIPLRYSGPSLNACSDPSEFGVGQKAGEISQGVKAWKWDRNKENSAEAPELATEYGLESW